MSPFLQLAFVIAIILIAAKLAGALSVKFGQPSVLGELLVGIVLGPTLVDFLHWTVFSDLSLEHFIIELGELGVLILMFMAGLELHLDELRSNTRIAAFAGVLGVLVPLGMGFAVGLAFGMEWHRAVFLGLVLGATSVSISAQTLMELKVLRSRVGLGLLGAAVFDDILVIFLLSLFLALTTGANGLFEILQVVGRMVLFLGLAFAFGLWLLPRLVRLVRALHVSQGLLTLALVVMLGYGVAAELLGDMAAITGTFIAGLMFARTTEKNVIAPSMSVIAYSFFVPIFFVSIGLHTTLSVSRDGFGLTLAVVVVALLGKWLGAGLGARGAGMSWRESAQLGMGMVSRGEVGLIVASAGIQAGLLNNEELATVVVTVIITTLVTPPALRASFQLPEGWEPSWIFRRAPKPAVDKVEEKL